MHFVCRFVPCVVAARLALAPAAHAQPEPAGAPAPPGNEDVFSELVTDLEREGDPEPPRPAATANAAPSSNALNPDIAVVADFAAAVFSDEEHLQTGAHDPADTGFNLQQLELSLGAAVDPYFRFDAFIVFGLFGVEVEEAYGTTTGLPERFQVRFGQFLTRFGRINATHPHSWDFVDQPFAIGRVFGAEGNRGLGIELSWLTPLPWYVELVGSVTRADGEASNRSFFGGVDLGVEGPADLLYVTALKQFFELSANWSLLWGVSAALGPNATGRSNRTDVYGTDLYLKYRPITRPSHSALKWQTEFLHRRVQTPETVLYDHSLYTQLVWGLDKRWAVGARYEWGSPSFNLDGNRAVHFLDPEWTDHRHRVSGALSYLPTEFSRLRLQGSADLPGWRNEPIVAVFLAAELAVGAHGAHPF
jgi:hypothetical protein